MKVLIINSSPRKDGNSSLLINEILNNDELIIDWDR